MRHSSLIRSGLLAGAVFSAIPPAAAQDACLATVPPQVTQRGPEGCRIQGAVTNGCGQAVRYVIVRAVPHPQRGPLPTAVGSVPRFGVAPLSFDRELCEQDVRLLELGQNGSSTDVTVRAMSPAVPIAEIEAHAARVNACVQSCAPPVTDRSAILAELRERYRHAVDDPEGQPALQALVDATVAERNARDRICGRVCQGALSAEDGVAGEAAATEARTAATAAAVATLGAIAARPPRAMTPDMPMPQAAVPDERGGRGRRGGAAASAPGPQQNCRPDRRGRQRCSLTLQLGPSAASTETRSGRGRRSEYRQGQRRYEGRGSSGRRSGYSRRRR